VAETLAEAEKLKRGELVVGTVAAETVAAAAKLKRTWEDTRKLVKAAELKMGDESAVGTVVKAVAVPTNESRELEAETVAEAAKRKRIWEDTRRAAKAAEFRTAHVEAMLTSHDLLKHTSKREVKDATKLKRN